MKTTIIGAGAYALGLSFMFYENNNSNITIYSKVEKEIEILKKEGKNDNYLKGVYLEKGINYTTNLEEALTDCDLIVIAVSTKYVKSICLDINKYYNNQPILIASKGIEQDSLLFVDSIVTSVIKTDKIAVLSGPTFAIDLAHKKTCGLTLASTNNETKQVVKKLLQNKYLKLRDSNDIKGVEICGAIKNVLAIACGILEGLEQSTSTRAMFLTEALHDVKYLIKSLGGNESTILSYAGFGDIILTCTSNNSRNYEYGLLLGSKETKELNEFIKTKTVEGVYTLKSLSDLLKKEAIELPIIELIYNIVFNEEEPNKLLEYLNKENSSC